MTSPGLRSGIAIDDSRLLRLNDARIRAAACSARLPSSMSAAVVARAARPLLVRPLALGRLAGAPPLAPTRTAFRFGGSQRRWQSSASDGAARQSWFRRMWESEVGIKTVHFWSVAMRPLPLISLHR